MLLQLEVRNPNRTPIPHWNKASGLSGVGLFEFKPGLNVIYGRNGTGKSTLITALAALTHCLDSNWATVSKVSISRFNRPTGYANGLLLTHDGSPVRYLGTEAMCRTPRTGVRKRDDIIVSAEARGATKNLSQGQVSTGNLIRLLKAEQTRLRREVTRDKIPESWYPLYDVAMESIENVKKRRDKRTTILLDEVDRSLDFVRQAEYWKQLRILSTHTQVIVASHSPFAVAAPAHFIEMTPGYLNASKKALSCLAPKKVSSVSVTKVSK